MKIIQKIKEKPIIEYTIATAFFILVSVLFAKFTGILDSGYHFTDDHEIIDINNQILNNGFFPTLRWFIMDDLSWRFRPLYFAVRVIRTLIFGTNFYLWHLFNAIECGLYMALSYILSRKMKTPILVSLIFGFIFMMGSQDEIIWRLGPQENMGMVLLPLTFLFTYLYFEKKNRIYGILTVVLTVGMMLQKESYMVLAPSVILFLFYLYVSNNNENINIFKKLWNFIKEYKWLIIFICLFLIICASIIVFFIGIMKPGYVGLDTSYTFYEYIRLTLNVLIVRDLFDFLPVYGIIVAILIYAIISKAVKKELNRKFWHVLLVFILLIGYSMGIEAVLYAKSAMFDRYKLPCLWFLYFALLVLEHEYLKPVVHFIIVLAVFVYVIMLRNNDYSSIVSSAKWYADDGKETTEMLKYVGSLNKNKEKTILTDFVWYEHNLSSSMYLQLEEGVSKVYYLDPEKEDGDYWKMVRNDGTKISFDDADIILTDDNMIEDFNLDDYNVSSYSWFYVLEKK